MVDLEFKYNPILKKLKEEKPFNPGIAIILGSGLGDFAESVDVKKTIITKSLPGYPPSTIEGHEGKIQFAEFEGKKLLLFQGRIHFYEGYSIYECVLPVLIAYSLGCKKIIITNAAGGININFKPGDLMLVTSTNSINIKKELAELIGLAGEKGKLNFHNFPSQSLNQTIIQAALNEKISLKEGVYWYTKGPSYETRSEIKMIGRFKGDAVGMSTSHEAVFASYLGMETSVISCITNYAAGITNKKLSHADVTETAKFVKNKFENLIKTSLSLID